MDFPILLPGRYQIDLDLQIFEIQAGIRTRTNKVYLIFCPLIKCEITLVSFLFVCLLWHFTLRVTSTLTCTLRGLASQKANRHLRQICFSSIQCHTAGQTCNHKNTADWTPWITKRKIKSADWKLFTFIPGFRKKLPKGSEQSSCLFHSSWNGCRL